MAELEHYYMMLIFDNKGIKLKEVEVDGNAQYEPAITATLKAVENASYIETKTRWRLKEDK
jgi:hypothetical protein